MKMKRNTKEDFFCSFSSIFHCWLWGTSLKLELKHSMKSKVKNIQQQNTSAWVYWITLNWGLAARQKNENYSRKLKTHNNNHREKCQLFSCFMAVHERNCFIHFPFLRGFLDWRLTKLTEKECWLTNCFKCWIIQSWGRHGYDFNLKFVSFFAFVS